MTLKQKKQKQKALNNSLDTTGKKMNKLFFVSHEDMSAGLAVWSGQIKTVSGSAWPSSGTFLSALHLLALEAILPCLHLLFH